MSREGAEEILTKLGHNGPRMVRADKAIRIIREQAGIADPEIGETGPDMSL